MKKTEIKIKKGIDAQIGAKLIDCAWHFKCNLFIEKGEKRMRAKSLMSVMSLALTSGDEITIIADGEDEDRAIDLLTKAFDSSFMNQAIIDAIKGDKS